MLGRGTTVVAHPDGELAAYLDSLDRIRALTGDGSVVRRSCPATDRSCRMPRRWSSSTAPTARSASSRCARRWPTGRHDEDDPVEGVLRRVYAQVPQDVWPAARLSIRAQLEYLAR